MLWQNRRSNSPDLHQILQTWSTGAGNLLRATLHESSILTVQGNDIGYRPKSDEIEVSSQIETRNGPSFEQSVAKFKDDADTAEIPKGTAFLDLRVNDRDAFRQVCFE